MDPMVVASFVAFLALIIGCLVAPTGTAAPMVSAQTGSAAAD